MRGRVGSRGKVGGLGAAAGEGHVNPATVGRAERDPNPPPSVLRSRTPQRRKGPLCRPGRDPPSVRRATTSAETRKGSGVGRGRGVKGLTPKMPEMLF